jgi:hypothetical protein
MALDQIYVSGTELRWVDNGNTYKFTGVIPVAGTVTTPAQPAGRIWVSTSGVGYLYYSDYLGVTRFISGRKQYLASTLDSTPGRIWTGKGVCNNGEADTAITAAQELYWISNEIESGANVWVYSVRSDTAVDTLRSDLQLSYYIVSANDGSDLKISATLLQSRIHTPIEIGQYKMKYRCTSTNDSGVGGDCTSIGLFTAITSSLDKLIIPAGQTNKILSVGKQGGTDSDVGLALCSGGTPYLTTVKFDTGSLTINGYPHTSVSGVVPFCIGVDQISDLQPNVACNNTANPTGFYCGQSCVSDSSCTAGLAFGCGHCDAVSLVCTSFPPPPSPIPCLTSCGGPSDTTTCSNPVSSCSTCRQGVDIGSRVYNPDTGTYQRLDPDAYYCWS